MFNSGITQNAARELASTLESLQAEIRRHLLLTLEYEGLKALVHASPVYHQQYLVDRKHILCACLETTLGRSTIHDACAVYQSGLDGIDPRVGIEIIRQFLGSYREQRSSGSSHYPSLFLNSLSLDQVISMVVFYASIIKPLVRHYAGQMLENLAKHIKKPASHEPLSRTEETMIVRGLYRFHLYCSVFGVGNIPDHRGLSSPDIVRFHDDDIFDIFMIYEAWEAEEFFCVYSFSRKKFSKVLDDMFEDLNDHPGHSRFRENYPLSKWTFHMEDGGLRVVYLEGIVSRGVELLHYILFRIKDHEYLLSTVPQQVTCPMGINYDDFLHLMWDRVWSDGYVEYEHPFESDQDSEDEEYNSTAPFHSDDGELAPLAWVLIKKDYQADLLYGMLGDEFRNWGYVMWDAARLEQTCAKELILAWFEDFYWGRL